MSNVIKASLWDKAGITKFGKLLDLSSYRHKLISGNIANVNTPDYAANDIDFKGEIDKALGGGQQLAMRSTSSKHISMTGPNRRIDVITHEAESADDLNGVDIDKEVTNLAINQMRYTAGAQMLQRKINMLSKAIKGR